MATHLDQIHHLVAEAIAGEVDISDTPGETGSKKPLEEWKGVRKRGAIWTVALLDETKGFEGGKVVFVATKGRRGRG